MNSPWHLYQTCFVVSVYIDNFTFIAHAQKVNRKVYNDRQNVNATPPLCMACAVDGGSGT